MKYGLIGKKLGHSYSKVIHGFLGNNEYELLELPEESIGDFLSRAEFKGLNVTIPYKEKVMPFCIPDETAKRIGCLNTIVNRNGTLCGYNTDYFGFLYTSEKSGIDFSGRKVVILGSGGTSKTAACAAAGRGAGEIVIVSRNGIYNYENISVHADADILVNTTPVGMYPDNENTPVDLNAFEKLYALLDVVFNPLRTRLILDAEERGIITARGLPMLVAQAVLAHELFFGLEPGLLRGDTMQKILAETEKHFSNIVLIGMPGSGKTTIGKKLADSLGRVFLDTDDIVENASGKRIPDIINFEGETQFREMERKAISEAAAAAGAVIATGGGAVLNKENRETLKQSGIIVFLDRDPECLPAEGRPLSVDIKALYGERLPIYDSMCDYKIPVTGDPDTAVQKIKEAIDENTGY